MSVGIDGVRIRAARPDEGELLREIAAAAKSHWGYDPERIRRWVAHGDFSPTGLSTKEVLVAEAGERAIAWAALIPKDQVIWLDDMWVDPQWIGKGVGSLLFDHALALARELGGRSMEWEAEPNAVGFYERMGGRYLRPGEPSEWGRTLSVMGVELT